jgi:two-component system nitrogen regulation response regulator GlnG
VRLRENELNNRGSPRRIGGDGAIAEPVGTTQADGLDPRRVGGPPSAPDAIRAGANDGLTKPTIPGESVIAARPVLECLEPLAEDKMLQGQLPGRDPLRELMGPSRQVEKVRRQVEQVADSPFTILIQGETGTGKELVARAIHHLSRRRRGPFIALDCGAVPETLIESELFGYEKGAFTGADQRKEGHFQLAARGTFLLDEIVNLPLVTQSKLLRAVQERAVQRLGGRRPIPVDVRIIATSNAPLDREVRAGRFRQDLYYRLNEFTITLPPLRERLDDIIYLANRFLVEAGMELRRPVHGISLEATQLLLRYPWPGNVRELRSMIRRAVLLSGDGIRPEHLFLALSPETSSVPPVEDPDMAPAGRSLKAIATAATAEAERRAICQALQAAKGNKSAVARRLQIDYKTLHLKMKRYGICAREFQGA